MATDMLTSNTGLEDLPVELLYDIQLYALSASLPLTSRHILEVFNSTPSSFRAQYILGRVTSTTDLSSVFTKALRYPLCTEEVIDSFSRQLPEECGAIFNLPTRLFRPLVPKIGAIKWTERDPPLPFLQYLCNSPMLPFADVNAYDGYALTKAVHAKFLPLVQFLLRNGASPKQKGCLAVMVAIRQKDLHLVKMLIERDGSSSSMGDGSAGQKKNKRRRLKDRVDVNQEMLKTAVRCDARDIVDYFTQEKGCVPNMPTLRLMMR